MSEQSPADAAEQGGPLPPVLAGPLLRHVESRRVVLWLVGSEPLTFRLKLAHGASGEVLADQALPETDIRTVRVGRHAWIYLLDCRLPAALPEGERIAYDLGVWGEADPAPRWIADWAPHLCLPGRDSPDFVYKPRLDRLLHGSCRRPHHEGADGLLRVDTEIAEAGDDPVARPALLMLSGDQVYVDDVAGPMLRAVHALSERLGLYEEQLEGAVVPDSVALRACDECYYGRERLLPDIRANRALLERFFGGARKPVFTTANAHNHLISLAEILAQYLLVWSPVAWQLVEGMKMPELHGEHVLRYAREQLRLSAFVDGLPRAARALAHVPSYMIFDDHDVTDDWNLSAEWEATAYGHPFSRRIIGNALIAYLLCQGSGNRPEILEDFQSRLQALFDSAREDGRLRPEPQCALVDSLLGFQGWEYQLPTQPPVIVLDTRTRRWRSETNRARPSGLMDWEALTDFQQALIHHRSVVVVSAAPIFGVKLIEVIQRVFTWLGKPLLVDAENWMAHRGAANVLLNIFRHRHTPESFVILSGDVHYSFAYDVRLRNRPDQPRIWQITSSGVKNAFPDRLLEWLDRLNRWLYAPASPLNWFTKRRRMRIAPRLPTGREAGERLWNGSGIGRVELDEDGRPWRIEQLDAEGGGTCFEPHHKY